MICRNVLNDCNMQKYMQDHYGNTAEYIEQAIYLIATTHWYTSEIINELHRSFTFVKEKDFCKFEIGLSSMFIIITEHILEKDVDEIFVFLNSCIGKGNYSFRESAAKACAQLLIVNPGIYNNVKEMIYRDSTELSKYTMVGLLALADSRLVNAIPKNVIDIAFSFLFHANVDVRRCAGKILCTFSHLIDIRHSDILIKSLQCTDVIFLDSLSFALVKSSREVMLQLKPFLIGFIDGNKSERIQESLLPVLVAISDSDILAHLLKLLDNMQTFSFSLETAVANVHNNLSVNKVAQIESLASNAAVKYRRVAVSG